MPHLARRLQIKHFMVLNALSWSVGAGLVLAQHYATNGPASVGESVIRHPVATYLSYWILSFLVFDLYLVTRRQLDFGTDPGNHPVLFWVIHTGGALAFSILHKTLSYATGLLLERLFLTQETRTWRQLVDLWVETFPELLPGMGVYFLLLFILVALDYRRRFREEQARVAGLQNQLAQTQLREMKTQLQPHFLFNALNTVAMMVRRKKATEAIGVIASLSEMLRSNLQRKPQQWITLAEELNLVNQYLAIEQVRYADRLRVEQRIAPDALPLRVPNLILQPLVENAFKHGIARSLSAARLEISARQEGQRLVIEVFNTGPALPAGWNLHDRRGIGLGNTVSRLMHLYQGDFRLQISEQDGGVRVRMVLPVALVADKSAVSGWS
ncbi:MAG: histidine kinase [Tunicatimonas sp.]